MKSIQSFLAIICTFVILMFGLFSSGCSEKSMQGAGTGAAVGGAAGAVGGLVTALVFGGNPGEAAARGAVWGASTGAVSGGIAGAQADSREKKQIQQKKVAELKKKFGEDGFSGLDALARCKHEIAIGYGRSALKSKNTDYKLAGLWLQVLSYKEMGDQQAVDKLYSQLVELDEKLGTDSQLEEATSNSLNQLKQIRGDFQLPQTCK